MYIYIYIYMYIPNYCKNNTENLYIYLYIYIYREVKTLVLHRTNVSIFFMLSVKLWLHLTVLISLYCLTAYFIEALKVSNGSFNYWWEKCVYPQIHKNKLAFKNKAFKVKNLTLELLRVGRLPPFTLKVKWFLNSLYSMNKVYSFVFIL